MRQRTKYKISTAILVALLLCLTLGYAFLTTNLNITGTTSIDSNTWNVYWDNVQVTTGSVSATTPTIDTNKTTVTFSAHLSKPGDFYEFTVDAVNDGTIDAMIENINTTINGNPLSNLPNYLVFSLTYSDGEEIKNNDYLLSEERETYKVKIEYNTDISPEDLPSSNETNTIIISSDYIQGENAIQAAKVFQLGDYVSYTPSKTSYEVGINCTDNNTDIFNPSELNVWRVIKMNRDGSIEMISEYTSNTAARFSGVAGYKKYVGCLNVLASQYETENYTIGSRHFGYNGQTEYIESSSKINSAIPWTCSTGDSCAPEQEEDLGGGDLLYLKDYNQVKNVLGTLQTKTASGANKDYWIASRVYNYDSWELEVTYFGRSVVVFGNSSVLVHYDIRTNTFAYYPVNDIRIRPIVVIKPSIKITSGSGTKQQPYQIAP